jgi:DNA repair photolyase
LAASGAVLETKSRVEYRELPSFSLLNRCDSPRVPFRWTINPYRGCEYGCKYCYARYTHEFMELRDPPDFEKKIFAKLWNPAAFRRELGRVDPGERIAIGTATDPYQPAERLYGITRSILCVLARERGRRLMLTTKSDLVVRDAELLAEIGRANRLNVSFSITTMNEKLARQMEPYAPRPDLRMRGVELLASKGIRVGVLANPILPLLNDSAAGIEAVACEAAARGATYFAGNVVFLKDSALRVFVPWLEEHYPHLVRRYRERFGRTGFLNGQYPEVIRQRVERAALRHGLNRERGHSSHEAWNGDPQLSLFPNSEVVK